MTCHIPISVFVLTWNLLQWRFTVAYVMMAAVCVLFDIGRRLGFGPAPVKSEEDGMQFQEDWYDVSDLAERNTSDAEMGQVAGKQQAVMSPSDPSPYTSSSVSCVRMSCI
jgi:hypothetical protein